MSGQCQCDRESGTADVVRTQTVYAAIGHKGKQKDNNSRLQHRRLIDNFSRRTDQTDTRTKCSHNIRVRGTIVTEDLTDRQYCFGNNTEKGMKAHFKSRQLAGYHRALSKTPGKYFRL